MLTERQRELRKKSVGASDVAAILGLSKYRSAWDVWAEKTGKLVPDQELSAAADAGNRFEDAVIEFASEKLGKLRRNVWRKHESLPLHAALDAQLVESGEPVEAKTAGLFSFLNRDEWGEEGTDEIPDAYLVQAQVQLSVTKMTVCHVPAFLGGRGFCLFRVQHSPDLESSILEAVSAFWTGNVEKDIPPDVAPTLEIVTRMRRTPCKVAPVDPRDVQMYLMAKEEAKAVKEDEDTIKARLLASLGDAEGSEPIEGIGALTYYEQERKGFDEKRFKERHPKVYEKYLTATKFRVLRVKKAKALALPANDQKQG